MQMFASAPTYNLIITHSGTAASFVVDYYLKNFATLASVIFEFEQPVE